MSGTRHINRIRKLRFENNEMTQEELASMAGCTRQTIIALEQEKYMLLELAFRMAKALGAGLEEVFQYRETPTKGDLRCPVSAESVCLRHHSAYRTTISHLRCHGSRLTGWL